MTDSFVIQSSSVHIHGTQATDNYAPPSAPLSDRDRANAIVAFYSEELGTGLNAMIAGQQGIPQHKKEEAYAAVDAALATGRVNTGAEGITLTSDILDMLREFAAETLKETEKSAEQSKGSSGHWLVVIARALGKIAGAHLSKMVEIGHKLGQMELADNATDKQKADQAAETAELTAEMQAHTQMYKLIQEALTTSIKTIGEALTTTARKQ